MLVRAKANGSIVELTDEAAELLIAAGIYEAVDDDADDEPPKPEKRSKDRYFRRDLRVEE